MAFGDTYGYKTNSRFVAAVAESDERTVDDGEGGTLNVVDLVLHGFANGRRNNVPVTTVTSEDPDPENNTAFDDVPNNTVVTAAEAGALLDGRAPGETTGASPSGVYAGGVSDQGGGAIA